MTGRNIPQYQTFWLLLVTALGCQSSVSGDEKEHGTVLATRSSSTSTAEEAGVGGAKAMDAGSNAEVGDAGLSADEAECLVAAKKVEAIINSHCLECHGNGMSVGGFSSVQSVPDMIAQGRITPGDRDLSRVYFLVSMNIMPRNDNKLTADESELVGDWIDCGATDWDMADGGTGTKDPVFYTLDDRLLAMRKDLLKFPNPVDRLRIRYIDFTALSNAGATNTQIETYKQAVSLLVNSLSFGVAVVEPIEVGNKKLIYRLDLRDYDWEAETWDIIVEDYPYAVIYNEFSRLFPYNEDINDELRTDTGTDVPYILADWFLAHASQPPVYYDVLEIGEDVNAEALELGVNIQQNIDDFIVERAGFALSGVAVHNRIIERHPLDGNGGAFWTTYDFVTSNNERNIFAHPFDFVHDAGETIFHLPNGLFGYWLSNAANQRLDKGDPNVVNDPSTRDRLIVNGLSCMGGCHLHGLIPKPDEVSLYTTFTAPDAFFANTVYSLYPPTESLTLKFGKDNARYRAAVAATGFVQTGNQVILNLVLAHELTLDLEEAASTLGIESKELLTSLNAHPEEFPPEVLNLRPPINSIFRETWDLHFAEVVNALGLGTSIDP